MSMSQGIKSTWCENTKSPEAILDPHFGRIIQDNNGNLIEFSVAPINSLMK